MPNAEEYNRNKDENIHEYLATFHFVPYQIETIYTDLKINL